MTFAGWYFPPLLGGARQGYADNNIEGFKGSKLLENFAREMIQNSLDAHLSNSDAPVKVVIELLEFDTKQYDVFSQFSECISGCHKYWGNHMDDNLRRFVDGATKAINKPKIPVLVVSDYNTTGLDGCRSRNLDSPWEAATGSNGLSAKRDRCSGGSYGIGSKAAYAVSSMRTVFYNTLTCKNEAAFTGVCHFVTHLNKDGKPTQGTGRYQVSDDKNERWEPVFPEDPCLFRDNFARTECGTDVIVVGFDQLSGWMSNVMRAVIKNFFVAINECRLVVELKDSGKHVVIDVATMPRLFDEFDECSEMIKTAQFYKALTNPNCKKTTQIIEPDDLEVYISSDCSLKCTAIAKLRNTRMLVSRETKRTAKKYSVVVIARGEKLSELLKLTESPLHDKWDYKQIDANDDVGKEQRREARGCIEDIDTFVNQLLVNQSGEAEGQTIDAAGVNRFLPDVLAGIGEKFEGDDILNPKVEIEEHSKKPSQCSGNSLVSVRNKGKGKDSETHDRGGSSIPKPKPPRRPRLPKDGSDNTSSRQGTKTSVGTSTKRVPAFLAKRALPVKSSQNEYRIIIQLYEGTENLFIECLAAGENGRSDVLELESFTYKNENVSFVGGKAGPMTVEAGAFFEFKARFKDRGFTNNENMTLEMIVTEEV